MPAQQWDSPPEMQIDETKNYSVSITTNRGTIELELYQKNAKQTAVSYKTLKLPTPPYV